MSKPLMKFIDWYEQAQNLHPKHYNAMALTTVSASGGPSTRVVLLKKYDERGFVFFTNYHSRKSQDIEENSQVALCFYWQSMEKQIRIEGSAEKIDPVESDEYFRTRPRMSQLGAWASKQSQGCQAQELKQRLEEFATQFPEQVPRPEFWGGYRVVPKRMEFWEDGEFRLHKRQLFEFPSADDWPERGTQGYLFP